MSGDGKRLANKERILKHIKIVDGCWEWTGSLQKNGYSNTFYWFNNKPTQITGHRLSYITFKGSIGQGLQIDHLCRNRACVNPEHLEAVTSKVNNLRVANGITTINKNKTHCIRGHEFSGTNLKIDARGHRTCKACRLDIDKRSRERRRIDNNRKSYVNTKIFKTN